MKLKLFALAFIFCATLSLTADAAFACSCGSPPPVLDAYERAHGVVIARVLSVQVRKSVKNDPDVNRYGPATFVVEKVYKGGLRVSDQISVGSDPNAACIWSFSEKAVGQQYLLYLIGVKESAFVFGASTCGRTRGLEYATEDLLYLDNMSTLRGKTRVSGNYRGGLGVTLENVANRTIRFVGEKKTYETKTDTNGVYEIYDLPPGKYLLEPEIPNGWQIAPYVELVGPQDPPRVMPLKALPFTLEANKHVSINVPFVPTSAVEGRVVGPDGNPMEGVCVHLRRGDELDRHGKFNCTDKNGNYRISGAASGSYVVVLNPDGNLSSDKPYRRLFYPSVAHRDKAVAITLAAGQTVKGIDFVITNLAETITVSGILRFSDGKPAAEELVTFAAVARDGFDGDLTETTDADGRFTLKIVKGLKGQIYGEFPASIGEYEKCSKLDALIRATGKDTADIKSPSIKIEAQHDIENLVLEFPFPRCKRKEY